MYDIIDVIGDDVAIDARCCSTRCIGRMVLQHLMLDISDTIMNNTCCGLDLTHSVDQTMRIVLSEWSSKP